MMTQRSVTFVFIVCALVASAIASAPASARDPARTIESSSAVLKEFLDLQVKQIPASLLAEAHGVAIVPNVIKLGFVVGGQRGHGVVIVREKDGSWRAPTFMTLTGGSIGWQIGAQATDFVLVFKTQKSVEGLLKGKFTIGADAAAAAGPVGRRAGASTDGELKAEIYTYSRTRGLFAGVSLDGSVIEIDDGANAAYYGATRPGEAAPAPPEAAVALAQLVAQLAANPELIDGRPVQSPASEPLPTPALPRNALEGPTLVPAHPLSSQPATPRPLPEQRSLIVPAPDPGRPAGPAAFDLSPPAPALASADDVQRELARSSRQLQLLLDKNWQRYLELPEEVYRDGRRPAAKDLKAAAERFERVAGEARYQALTGRAEFQATLGLLHAYLDAVAAGDAPKLALPPPPGGQR